MNPYIPAFSPSIPLQQRIAAMEQMQMQSPYGQMYANMNNPYLYQNPQTPVANTSTQVATLQGEVVSDYETVKAMKANLDGTTAYYPSTDGKVIYTKSLAPDGSSNILTYERVESTTPLLTPNDDKFEKIEEYVKNTNDKIEMLFNAFMGTSPAEAKKEVKK